MNVLLFFKGILGIEYLEDNGGLFENVHPDGKDRIWLLIIMLYLLAVDSI